MPNKTCSVLLLFLIASTILFCSCSPKVPHSGDISTGIARDSALVENDKVNVPDTADTTETTESSHNQETDTDSTVSHPDSGAIDWHFENGKYVYEIGPRDESGLQTIDEMQSTPKTPYEDQPDDWYFGKTSYDETTGTVTYVWDRSQATIDSVHKYNGIYRGDETKKTAYITFDCGYEYGTTSQLLDILKEKQCPAIFFPTGYYVQTQHDLLARMLDEGHLIGNHTVNHLRATDLSVDEFLEEVNGLEKLFLEQFPDGPKMRYYRPPSGTCNEWVLKLADKMGYKTVLWSFAYYDYDTANQPTPQEALQKAKDALHPGIVYLLHAESTANVGMLGDLIDWIRAQGYEILPVCAIN